MKRLNNKIIFLVVLLVFGLPVLTQAQGIIDLPKTGQSTSYATGDDGDLQMGVAWPVPRFIDHGDGTITDILTGLMWTKNANLLGASKTWQEALNYVSAMNAGEYENFGYTDWRMPNIIEIESLINAEQSDNALWLNSQGFTNIPDSLYWSSSSSGPEYTAVIRIMRGIIFGTYKSYRELLWPVRSAQLGTIQLPKTGLTYSYAEGDDGDLQMGIVWPDPRFIDNGDGTVTDNLTGLIWTKNVNLPNGKMTWQEALNYIASLNESQYLGYSDWRLPNRKELGSVKWYVSRFAPEDPFTNVPPYPSWGTGYWTSTTCAYDPNNAWGVGLLWAGEVTSFDKTSQCYVWPVRAGEFLPCIEKFFTESTLVETLLSQKVDLNNVAVTGDFNTTLNFTNFEIVTITTGPFTGKGFSKGECQTTLESISYTGNWKGVLFFKPQEKKIYLKGTISGEISAIVEGYLTESNPNSGIYDQYQATWKIGRLGSTITSATINLNGTLIYQGSSEYSSTELYILQTNLEGTISGHYTGFLSSVLTHLRIVDEINPYYGEGFSIISYVSESGSGEGWTYDKVIELGKVELKGMFTSPLFGIVSAILDESELPRKLLLTIERVDLGLPPQPDLKVKVWGPQRVSPGQTINYIIEYRNDGLKGAEDVIVLTVIDLILEYISGSTEAYHNKGLNTVGWNLGKVSAKTDSYLSIQAKVPWGLAEGTILESYAYIVDLLSHSSQENLALNGIGTILEKDPIIGEYIYPETRNWVAFSKERDAIPSWVYTDGDLLTDIWDVYFASPYNPDGNPIFNERNGGNVLPGHYPKVFAFSGGTRSAISLIKSGRITTDELILISPILTSSEELRELKEKGVKITIYQSPKDDLLKASGNFFIEVDGTELYIEVDGRIVGNLIKIKWMEGGIEIYNKEFYLQGDNSNNGQPFKSEEGIEVLPLTGPHAGLVKEIETQGKEGMSSSTPHTVTTARDPNEKLVSPEGDVRPGERLNYAIHYENEGEGIAYGVYITDTLDEDLDDKTITVNNNGSYDPKTRTIAWFIGQVDPHQKGSVSFSVNVKTDVPDKSEVINFATVYFPSVPEATRTNGTVNRIIVITDNIPPTTTATVSPSSNQAGWNNTNVTITLTSIDNEGGLGVKEIHYKLTGAVSEERIISGDTAQIVISTEATTLLTYHAVDNAGNTETAKTLEIKIDKTPPTITATISPQPNFYGWNNTDVTVSFIANDNLSGVASVTEPITITAEGKDQYIEGEAIDYADKRATTYTTVNLDKTPPEISLQLQPLEIKPPFGREREFLLPHFYKFIYSAKDNLSGVKDIKAGLITPDISDYKTKLIPSKRLVVIINELRRHLIIIAPNPESVLNQLKQSLFLINNNQTLHLNLRPKSKIWTITQIDKFLGIRVPSIIFKANATDYADNTQEKQLPYQRKRISLPEYLKPLIDKKELSLEKIEEIIEDTIIDPTTLKIILERYKLRR